MTGPYIFLTLIILKKPVDPCQLRKIGIQVRNIILSPVIPKAAFFYVFLTGCTDEQGPVCRIIGLVIWPVAISISLMLYHRKSCTDKLREIIGICLFLVIKQEFPEALAISVGIFVQIRNYLLDTNLL